MIKSTDTFVGNIRKLCFFLNELNFWLNFIILFQTTITKIKQEIIKKLFYLTNGHNRLATGTIKAFCHELNIFTVCSLYWKVKRVLSCVVLIMEFRLGLDLATYCLGPISANDARNARNNYDIYDEPISAAVIG